ncbi:hypothetical protein Hanom_Chr08g00699651 [Helianthus anomalus]
MLVLASFKSGEDMERFFTLAKDNKESFRSVEKWVGQTMLFERIAWLRIQGIPLHLLDNSIINMIGGKFGKIIQEGQHGEWDSDLSYDYVGILVSEVKRIQEEVVVQWRGRRYRVWVEEEIGEWEPEFLGKDRGVEVTAVNRSQSPVPECQTGSNPVVALEGAMLSEGNKESSQNDVVDDINYKEDPKIIGEAIGYDSVDLANFGVSFKESFLTSSEGKLPCNKRNKGWKKGGRC